MKKRFVLITVVLLSLMTLFAGCGSGQDTGDTTGDNTDNNAPEKTVLKVGVDDTYPPMEYRDENNDLVGFDVDLAKAIGEKLDMEVEFIPNAWSGIFIGLESENYDVIISSVSMTPERLENYEFTKPYLSNGQVIVTRPDDSSSITSLEDLSGKSVGVQLETTADTAVSKFESEYNITVTRYDEIVQTFNAMTAGYVDYIVVDLPVALDYEFSHPDLYKVTDTILTNEPIAVCLKKGNTELKEKIDTALNDLKTEGKLKEISENILEKDYTSDINEELDAIE